MSNQSIVFDTSEALDINTFTRSGYTFSGWNTSANGTGTSYADEVSFTMNILGDTLYAQWSAIDYTITFNSNGGTSPSPTNKTVTYNSTYGTLATTSRSGYSLDGWFTSSTGGTEITSSTTVSIVGNDTLYAQWTESSTQTDAPSITDSYYNGVKEQIGWKVLNNDSSTATLYSDLVRQYTDRVCR